jgi:hypothetical protein
MQTARRTLRGGFRWKLPRAVFAARAEAARFQAAGRAHGYRGIPSTAKIAVPRFVRTFSSGLGRRRHRRVRHGRRRDLRPGLRDRVHRRHRARSWGEPRLR